MSGQFYTDKFHFTPEQIGYTMALVGFISVLYQGFLVRFIRAYLDEKNMLLFAFLILMVSFVGFGWTKSVFWLLFWIAFFPI
jgi:predicted MFS family arabinose efflux permease